MFDDPVFSCPNILSVSKQTLNSYIIRCLKNIVLKNPAPGEVGREGFHICCFVNEPHIKSIL